MEWLYGTSRKEGCQFESVARAISPALGSPRRRFETAAFRRPARDKPWPKVQSAAYAHPSGAERMRHARTNTAWGILSRAWSRGRAKARDSNSLAINRCWFTSVNRRSKAGLKPGLYKFRLHSTLI